MKDFLLGPSESNENELCEFIPKGYIKKHISELESDKDSKSLWDKNNIDGSELIAPLEEGQKLTITFRNVESKKLSKFLNIEEDLKVRNPRAGFEAQQRDLKLIKENTSEKLDLRAREIYDLLVGTGKEKFISKVVSFDNLVEYLDCYKNVDYFIDKIDENLEMYIYNLEHCIEVLKSKKEKLNNLLSKAELNEKDKIQDALWKVENKLRINEVYLEKTRDKEAYKIAKLKIPYNLTDKIGGIISKEYLEDYFERFKMFVDEIWTDAFKNDNLGLIDSPNELKLLYIILKGGNTNLSISNAKRLGRFLFKSKCVSFFHDDLLTKLGFSCYIKAIGSVRKAELLLDNYENELKALTIANYKLSSYEDINISERLESNAYTVLAKALRNIKEIDSELDI